MFSFFLGRYPQDRIFGKDSKWPMINVFSALSPHTVNIMRQLGSNHSENHTHFYTILQWTRSFFFIEENCCGDSPYYYYHYTNLPSHNKSAPMDFFFFVSLLITPEYVCRVVKLVLSAEPILFLAYISDIYSSGRKHAL